MVESQTSWISYGMSTQDLTQLRSCPITQDRCLPGGTCDRAIRIETDLPRAYRTDLSLVIGISKNGFIDKSMLGALNPLYQICIYNLSIIFSAISSNRYIVKNRYICTYIY